MFCKRDATDNCDYDEVSLEREVHPSSKFPDPVQLFENKGRRWKGTPIHLFLGCCCVLKVKTIEKRIFKEMFKNKMSLFSTYCYAISIFFT